MKTCNGWKKYNHKKSSPSGKVEELTALIEEFSSRPGITPAKMFGASALKVNGKVFAMVVKGKLVVRLPHEQVTTLVTTGKGEYFDPGHGRLMKAWLQVVHSSMPKVKWQSLLEDAQRFIASDS